MSDFAETEGVNPRSRDIDLKTTSEILSIINAEDATVAAEVKKALPEIVPVVDLIVEKLDAGGRLIYVGVGTSGRLAVQDAAECPPTYGVPVETVTAIIAGGVDAMIHPVESAEDDAAAGTAAIVEAGVNPNSLVLGISANGNTPYVCGALAEAKKRGAATAVLLCNKSGKIEDNADLAIHVLTGAEVISGSTRMKAGTAQKMVLNMLTTAAMIRLGRVTGNFMTAMQPINAKLRKRAVFIVSNVTSLPPKFAEKALDTNNWNIRAAIQELRQIQGR
jgi:N-acetylmuramic acid 6-phosphate etherase